MIKVFLTEYKFILTEWYFDIMTKRWYNENIFYWIQICFYWMKIYLDIMKKYFDIMKKGDIMKIFLLNTKLF